MGQNLFGGFMVHRAGQDHRMFLALNHSQLSKDGAIVSIWGTDIMRFTKAAQAMKAMLHQDVQEGVLRYPHIGVMALQMFQQDGGAVAVPRF